MTIDRPHSITGIDVDERGDIAYIEGYSTKATYEGSAQRAHGELTYGWFCVETDSTDDARRHLHTLGFDDDAILAAVANARTVRLTIPERFVYGEKPSVWQRITARIRRITRRFHP